MKIVMTMLLCLLPFVAIAQEAPAIPPQSDNIPCAPIEVVEKNLGKLGFKKFFSGKSENGLLLFWRNTEKNVILTSVLVERGDEYFACLVDGLKNVREYGPI